MQIDKHLILVWINLDDYWKWEWLMKTLVALCPYVAYNNEQLLKDCVLIPYSFTNLDYQVKLVTAKKEEFTYLNLRLTTLLWYHGSSGLII